MINKLTTTLSVAFLLFAAGIATAQNAGTVTGVIIDGSNGEALLGANVLLEGTSRGASTGTDGTFIIRNVQPGEHTIIATYIGYDRVEQDIVVEAGEETQVEIVMDWSGLTGDDIVISAQARGQTSAINEQLRSRHIQNVVSSERIRELPDASAATALSRLPGVSLQQGDKIVIRGMQAKLNTISINGIQLPSTDLNDRSTNLGFISANMLDGVEVTKAVTPDMDANSTGGAVNLRLREAPAGWNFDVLAQGSYNTQDRTLPGQNAQTWASVSNRFLDDRLGVFVQGNYNRRDGGADIASAEFVLHSDHQDFGWGQNIYSLTEASFVDEVHIVNEYGGSVILDYRLPNGKLSLQNTIANTESDFAALRDIMIVSGSARNYRISRDINTRQLLINALQGEYQVSDLEMDFTLSHAMSSQDTDLRYGQPWNGITFSNTSNPNFPTQSQREITLDDFFDLPLEENNWRGATATSNHGTEDQIFEQRVYTGALNFMLPVQIGNTISAEFKTGGQVVYTNRENDIRLSRAVLGDPGGNNLALDWMNERGMNTSHGAFFPDFIDHDYGEGRGEYYMDGRHTMNRVIDVDLLDQYTRLLEPGWGRHLSSSNKDDFTANEMVSAGYFMGTFDIGNRLTITTGARYEHFNMDYNANFVYETHGVYGDLANLSQYPDRTREIADSLTNVQRDYGHLFPNFQAQYSFTDWLDMRFAYTRTISRPDFSMMIPNVFRASGAGEGGNPYLNPTLAHNLDFNVSVYNNEIGLFTAGLFYKELDDVFYGIDRLYAALPEGVNYPNPEVFEEMGFSGALGSTATISTFMNNEHTAYVHGFELDWQTNFWYLPAPFSSMVLNINYTRAFSEMDYRVISFERENYIDDRGRPGVRTVEVDTTRTGRLLFQGDHIINIALGADYRGFSGRASFRLQGDVITSVGTRPEGDWFDENVYGWDFSIRQQLPIEGLSLALSGVNITHSPTRTYRYFRRFEDGSPQASSSNQLANLRYDARQFELGLRFTF